MALKPEVSIPTALALGGLVLAMHNNATPTLADLRGSVPGTMPHNSINKARRQTTWAGIGLVSAISLVAHDANLFMVGGAMVVGLDLWTRHANDVVPQLGRAVGQLGQIGLAEQAAEDVAAVEADGMTPSPYGANVPAFV